MIDVNIKGVLYGIAAVLPQMQRRNPGTSSTSPLPQHLEVHMEIKRIGSEPSGKGPAEWFTGTVRIDPLFQPHAPARAAGASVTFEPGPGRPGTPIRWARP